MRFLSFNIHGCVGRDGREDPERVLRVIREADADVVALQEVDDKDAEDQTVLKGLEAMGGARVIYGPTLRRESGPYGNVLISRLPVRSFERIDLSMETAEPRGAIRAILETTRGPVRVTATHLGLGRRERRKQIDRLLVLEGTGGGEAFGVDVMLGDLNEWNRLSGNLRRLARNFPVRSRLATFPAARPVFALDRICLRGVGAGEVRFSRIDTAVGRRASDHRAVLAEVTSAPSARW